MTVRPALTLLACSAALVCGTAPAVAQADPEAVLRAVVACSAIADVPARVACYDGTVPGAKVALQADRPAEPAPKSSFGLARVPQPKSQAAPAVDGVDELHAAVSAVGRVRDGIYTIALADGSEWRFLEGVPLYFSPPRPGTEVKVEHGALGSFRMLIPGQRPVRVTRTK
jgi:hypothetical protein